MKVKTKGELKELLRQAEHELGMFRYYRKPLTQDEIRTFYDNITADAMREAIPKLKENLFVQNPLILKLKSPCR